MRLFGFSTGALALSDFRKALKLSRSRSFQAIELSAIRKDELEPLIAALDELDLGRYSYISIHAPSAFQPKDEGWIFQSLFDLRDRGWPIVVHPDTLDDLSLWRTLGNMLCVENMDKRKRVGRTVGELESIFEQLPEASFCLDIGHARQIDTSMVQAYRMLKDFKDRLRQIHVSDVSSLSKHTPLSFVSILDFQEIAPLIPESVPIIIESIVTEDQIDAEVARVLRALPLAAVTA
jgi:hypothetical protein